jgi:hypothetical protein
MEGLVDSKWSKPILITPFASCHGKDKKLANPEAIRIHTKHNYAPRQQEPVGAPCHMVKTAASAEAGDIHAHDFKIIKPQLSLETFRKDPKNVVPNSCSGCHKDWAKDERDTRRA